MLKDDDYELNFRMDAILKRLRQKKIKAKKNPLNPLYRQGMSSLQEYHNWFAISYQDVDFEKLIEN